MKLTFNTLIADVSIALKAINNYRAGSYEQAITSLHDILDSEPMNWDARLMLAACYYKTEQWSSAHRAFAFIVSRTNDNDIRAKALEGQQVTSAKLNNWIGRPGELPAEFGCFVERLNQPKQRAMSWL